MTHNLERKKMKFLINDLELELPLSKFAGPKNYILTMDNKPCIFSLDLLKSLDTYSRSYDPEDVRMVTKNDRLGMYKLLMHLSSGTYEDDPGIISFESLFDHIESECKRYVYRLCSMFTHCLNRIRDKKFTNKDKEYLQFVFDFFDRRLGDETNLSLLMSRMIDGIISGSISCESLKFKKIYIDGHLYNILDSKLNPLRMPED